MLSVLWNEMDDSHVDHKNLRFYLSLRMRFVFVSHFQRDRKRDVSVCTKERGECVLWQSKRERERDIWKVRAFVRAFVRACKRDWISLSEIFKVVKK